MPFSHLQIAQLQIGQNNALILKNDPSSRKIVSLDRRRKDALLFEMLNNEVVLTKLQGDNNKKYWIMMNMQGETVPMDEKMKQVLESKDWTVLRVKQLIDENERPVIVLVLTCYEFRETDEDDQKANNKKDIIALPNVAYLRLDKDGQKVLYKRKEEGKNLQQKFDLQWKEA